MFGLSTSELIVILMVALIFIGPGKLPEVARSLGKGLRKIREAMAGLEAEVHESTRDFREGAEQVAAAARQAREEVGPRPAAGPGRASGEPAVTEASRPLPEGVQAAAPAGDLSASADPPPSPAASDSEKSGA
jgi:TatA/E family protein of Tat protein translocase